MSLTPVSHSTLGLYAASRSSFTQQAPSEEQFWGKGETAFDSLLDTINPLQQLPIVSNIYRAVTGDPISTGARLAGGALFGGPLGLISALVNTIVENQTGNDIGGNVISALSGENAPTAATEAAGSLAGQKAAVSATDRAAYLAYSNAVKLG
jgi:hypothetical protein